MAYLNITEILNAVYDSTSGTLKFLGATASAALADAAANPTLGRFGTFPSVFNGTTWDRIRGGAQSNVAAATGFLSTLGVGQYNATPPSVTDTRFNNIQLDAAANLRVTLATLIAGEDQAFNRMSIEQAFGYQNIATQTTTTVKSGAGRLARIIIPTLVASATIKIYDNTAGSGTVIMDTLTNPATLLDQGPRIIEFGVAFSTGLTIVTAGATQPITVVYI